MKFENYFYKNKYIVLSIGVIVGILVMIPVVFFAVRTTYFKDTTVPSNKVESGEKKPVSTPGDILTKPETPAPSSSPVVSPGPSSVPESPIVTPETKTEADVIRYFEEQEQLFTSAQSTSITESLLSTLKNGFTTMVDFLFYEKPIYGYTFDQLSSTAKLKVLKIASMVDGKIDQYFPGYKNSIKSGFESLKAKAVSLYLTTTSKLCDVVGSDTCAQAREDFKNMKEYLKIDWNLIKGFVKESTGAIKEWYESFRVS